MAGRFVQVGSAKLASSNEVPVVHDPDRGVVPIADLGFAPDLPTLFGTTTLAKLAVAAERAPDSAFHSPAEVVAPYRNPRKIWGIGLNYLEHAGDLSENVPTEPASFMKGDHTIIGPGDPIPVPSQSRRTTAEAELGLVIGRECYQVEEDEALDHIFGVVPVLDQTAEDILEKNPRFLTRSKNFPGFFSFGPWITSLDAVLAHWGSLDAVEVSTVLNGEVHRSNTIANMAFSPAFLVSFHSKVMPLYPGDIISPGTPGAVHITVGDTAESRIPGVGTLTNPVTTGR
ncbi:fumarylacetoacetate hydrolase family protein [Kribbella capetownensis]|uniref:Fumarylacetoacetate hydrolase family protein n=1 Tax=Kribbella capetownensis TaxID=1572659 RepID=A0A4R0K1T3_9ACTN|nr:fumarylacetoacetate hydrolase family protein [Kribbella capetownensis]TCC53923.1 fumarylacetoacetate hydrolase family protein [Kribbella capetownensis]